MAEENQVVPRRKRRVRRWSSVLVLALIAAVAAGIWLRYRSDGASGSQQFAPPPVTVTAARAAEENWQKWLSAVGTLSAPQGVQVTTELAGLVSDIHFQSGQSVSEGDLLVELSTVADRARLASLTAQTAQAKADLARQQRLVKRGAVATADVEQSATALESLQAQMREQKALIAKKRIRAPFSGKLGIRLINVGQYLPPGSEIVTLQSLAPIHVDFSLPEQHYGEVAPGQTLHVRVAAFPDRSFQGVVSAISPRVEEQTRSFDVQGRLANENELLHPGMFSDVTVILPQQRRVITVPATAITYSPYGNSVFVVREPSAPKAQDEAPRTQPAMPTVSRAYVRVGERRGAEVAIASGLQPGARVVTAGQIKLFDGAPVNISQGDALARAEPTTTAR